MSAFCCKPVLRNTKCSVAGLQKVNKNLILIALKQKITLNLNQKICKLCARALYRGNIQPVKTVCKKSESSVDESTESDVESVCSKSSLEANLNSINAVETLNNTLEQYGASPIKKKRLVTAKYRNKKFQSLNKTLNEKVFKVETTLTMDQQSKEDSDRFNKMISNLKVKYNNSKTSSERLTILTLLPEDWSVYKIQKEFKTTQYLAKQSKELFAEKGILSVPNVQTRPGITTFVLNCTIKQIMILVTYNN